MALNDAHPRSTGTGRAPRTKRNFALISIRLNKGWTPNDLGDQAGVSGNTVRSAERGVYVDVRSQFAIATALGAEVTELFPLDRQKFERKKPKENRK